MLVALTRSAFLRAGSDQEDRVPLRLFGPDWLQKGNPFVRRRAEMLEQEKKPNVHRAPNGHRAFPRGMLHEHEGTA
jgi:hypothetical protein